MMSNTSSFHQSHMQQSAVSGVAGCADHGGRPFKSYVQADKEKVQTGAQTKGWVQSRVANRDIPELNEVRETIVRTTGPCLRTSQKLDLTNELGSGTARTAWRI